MQNPASLLLTAVISLAVGAGGTYALVRVEAQCSVVSTPTAPVADDNFRKFMAEPPDRVGGGVRY